MTPGELLTDGGEHALNPGRRTATVLVKNASDRPIQVGSHYHFAETNGALGFDRVLAQGMRLHVDRGIVVNDTIKSAVLLIVGHLYAQREDVVVGVSVAKLPNGAEWLLAPYQVYA